MGLTVQNYIGIVEGGVPETVCDAVINVFDEANKLGRTYSRQRQDKTVSKTMKDDLGVDVVLPMVADVNIYDPVRMAMDYVWQAFDEYTDIYATMRDVPKYTCHLVKIQKTAPSQGYHVWHFESGHKVFSSRVAAFSVYLNDVVDGGETEFLYQSMRVKPTKGTILIFPVSYTHTHRGNPPLSGDKYLMTSWFEAGGD
jgi:hypothetical protein